MDEISDEVVRRCQEGDIQSLEAIYRVYGDRVYRLCLRMTGREADAEDLVHQIFLRVFEQAGKFAGRSRFSTWLFRLATNHCLNALNTRARRDATSNVEAIGDDLPDDASGSPLQAVLHAEEREAAWRLLDRLDPVHRSTLVLRELERMSYREIAEAQDVPIGTVMSRLSRARRKLTSILEDEGER